MKKAGRDVGSSMADGQALAFHREERAQQGQANGTVGRIEHRQTGGSQGAMRRLNSP